jgi:hypothetical protein
MVTVTWGNVLAIVIPGGLAIFGLRFVHHTLADLLAKPNELTITGATCLLIAAVLVGGILDGLRRVVFEDRFTLLRSALRRIGPTTAPGLYEYITPENLSVFETLVENSYRYYAFYGNLLCALLVMLPVRLFFREANWLDVALWFLAPVVGYAAYVQHSYFRVAMDGFMAVEKKRREGGKARC